MSGRSSCRPFALDDLDDYEKHFTVMNYDPEVVLKQVGSLGGSYRRRPHTHRLVFWAGCVDPRGSCLLVPGLISKRQPRSSERHTLCLRCPRPPQVLQQVGARQVSAGGTDRLPSGSPRAQGQVGVGRHRGACHVAPREQAAWILDPCSPCCLGTLGKGTPGQSSFRGEGLKPQLAAAHLRQVGLARAEAEPALGGGRRRGERGCLTRRPKSPP